MKERIPRTAEVTTKRYNGVQQQWCSTTRQWCSTTRQRVPQGCSLYAQCRAQHKYCCQIWNTLATKATHLPASVPRPSKFCYAYVLRCSESQVASTSKCNLAGPYLPTKLLCICPRPMLGHGDVSPPGPRLFKPHQRPKKETRKPKNFLWKRN